MLVFQYTGMRMHELREKLVPELKKFLVAKRDVVFTPEYKYRTFFFSDPDNFPSYASKMAMAEQLKLAEKLILSSPDTRVYFFAKTQKKAEDIIGRIKDAEFGNAISLFLLQGRLKVLEGSRLNEIWAQDMGEPTGAANKMPEFMVGMPAEWVPERHEPFYPSFTRQMQIRARQMPVVLQGGNVTKAVSKDGKKLVIVGSDELAMTQYLYSQHANYKISTSDFKDVYKKAFGADDVLILGGASRQIEEMFHIDQAVLFPKDGVAVMVKVPKSEDSAKVVEMCEGYKKQLIAAGFDVIEIPADYHMMLKIHISYANAICYENAYSRKTEILLPSFGNEKLEGKIREILEKNGFRVEFVKDMMWKYDGNAHCITGALSYMDLVPRKNAGAAKS
ncbi:MAG: agmatine deiminase family protein [Candidatus Micrarchaeota archaeon]|nr:agmatine deiminase family protein [Candidatus Micrarchaeota archaeon]